MHVEHSSSNDNHHPPLHLPHSGLRRIAACHLDPKGIQYEVRGPGCMVGFEAYGLPKGLQLCNAASCAQACWQLAMSQSRCLCVDAGVYLSKELQKAALKHNLMLLTCGNDTVRCASRFRVAESHISSISIMNRRSPGSFPHLPCQLTRWMRVCKRYCHFTVSHCVWLNAFRSDRCRHARCDEENVTSLLDVCIPIQVAPGPQSPRQSTIMNDHS